MRKSKRKEERGSGGGKLMRSETVTVRLDPKLRYLAELAGLKHRRTLSSFIEWAIERALQNVQLREGSGSYSDPGVTIADAAEDLWDVDEADRFAKLALRYPELLTHDEQKRWKVIREFGYLWRGHYGKDSKWKWIIAEKDLIFERVRENWSLIGAVADGELPLSDLPTVVDKDKREETPKSPPDEFDDDIPF